MENLDMKCVELGQTIANITRVDEKLITTTLGVLEEQGLYAAMLFLEARGKEAGNDVCKKVSVFFEKTPENHPLVNGNNNIKILDAVKELSKNLDDLLFARDLIRQSLIYARYHVKAR